MSGTTFLKPLLIGALALAVMLQAVAFHVRGKASADIIGTETEISVELWCWCGDYRPVRPVLGQMDVEPSRALSLQCPGQDSAFSSEQVVVHLPQAIVKSVWTICRSRVILGSVLTTSWQCFPRRTGQGLWGSPRGMAG